MRFHQNTAIPVTEQFENEMPCEFCHLTFKLKFDLEKHSVKCQKNNSSLTTQMSQNEILIQNIEYNLNPLDFLHHGSTTETEMELNIKTEPEDEEILSSTTDVVNKQQLMISKNLNNFDKETEKNRKMEPDSIQ